jgi:pimeloyl-ACP methyl ester carboxylesterase
VKAPTVIALTSLALLAGCGGGHAAAPTPAASAKAAGRLTCSGTGSPTVLVESGLGVDPLTTWSGVVPELARATRVCVHERPGTGASPPLGHSRTASAVEGELEKLVDTAHIGAPVVLVGASFGGYVAQLYAGRRPGDVGGVVLVDSLHPDIDRAFARLFGADAAAARARQLEQNTEGITFADLERSAREVAAEREFPPVPLVVLEHGISFDPGGDPDPRLERAWGRMQRELAARSPRGELIVAARSHHRIAEDQPALVTRAVERTVDAVR